MIKKLVITGPESSGKTTLAKLLATQNKLPLIPEYARTYLEQHGSEYTRQDVLLMAKDQLKQESSVENLAICDTDLSVFAVWIKEKYQQEIDWINQHLLNANHKFYILCAPDIPWEEDALREHPDSKDRLRLFKEYQNLLERFQLNYLVVEGSLSEREKKCQEILDNLI